MRTRAALFFVFATALCPLVQTPLALAGPHPVSRVAPADEYFGRMKMSILEIRNRLHDLSRRLRYSPRQSRAVLGMAEMVEDSMLDWAHKYPADPWLPKSVYELTDIYSRIHTPQGHARASHALHWLLAWYGRSPYSAQARAHMLTRIAENRK